MRMTQSTKVVSDFPIPEVLNYVIGVIVEKRKKPKHFMYLPLLLEDTYQF